MGPEEKNKESEKQQEPINEPKESKPEKQATVKNAMPLKEQLAFLAEQDEHLSEEEKKIVARIQKRVTKKIKRDKVQDEVIEEMLFKEEKLFGEMQDLMDLSKALVKFGEEKGLERAAIPYNELVQLVLSDIRNKRDNRQDLITAVTALQQKDPA